MTLPLTVLPGLDRQQRFDAVKGVHHDGEGEFVDNRVPQAYCESLSRIRFLAAATRSFSDLGMA